MEVGDVLTMLRTACDQAGGMRAWSRTHGTQVAYVSAVLLGKREPGPAILTALGLERVVTYRHVTRSLISTASGQGNP